MLPALAPGPVALRFIMEQYTGEEYKATKPQVAALTPHQRLEMRRLIDAVPRRFR